MNVMVRRLPLDRINPFDQVHRDDGNGGVKCQDRNDTREHWAGIRHARQLLRNDVSIRPIVVMPMGISPFTHIYGDKAYHRLDGFKRFWAHKLEGIPVIDCLVVDQYAAGAQHGHPMTVEDEEWETFTMSSPK